MRNTPLKAFASPMKDPVDTKLADKVFSSAKVNEELIKRNLHTFKGGRGTENTTPKENASAGNNQMMNPN